MATRAGGENGENFLQVKVSGYMVCIFILNTCEYTSQPYLPILMVTILHLLLLLPVSVKKRNEEKALTTWISMFEYLEQQLLYYQESLFPNSYATSYNF